MTAGRADDAPATAISRAPRRGRLALEFVRDIRSPRWGTVGQGLRFGMSGGVVALVYATVTTVLHNLFSLPFELALAIGYVISAITHYTLQRVFVWRHSEQFALRAHSQLVRYLCLSLGQYGITALATARLPGLLGLPVDVVYLTIMLTLAVVNFTVFRTRIFHAGSAEAVSTMPG